MDHRSSVFRKHRLHVDRSTHFRRPKLLRGNYSMIGSYKGVLKSPGLLRAFKGYWGPLRLCFEGVFSRAPYWEPMTFQPSWGPLAQNWYPALSFGYFGRPGIARQSPGLSQPACFWKARCSSSRGSPQPGLAIGCSPHRQTAWG